MLICTLILFLVPLLSSVSGGHRRISDPRTTHSNKTFRSPPAKSVTSDTAEHRLLKCCSLTTNDACAKVCRQMFGRGSFRFESDQIHERQSFCRKQFPKYRRCLDDVDFPCKPHCKDNLHFCKAVVQSGRRCTSGDDNTAAVQYSFWIEEKRISLTHENISLPILGDDVDDCRASKLKQLACAAHIKPCNPRWSRGVLCRQDCKEALFPCYDENAIGYLEAAMAIERICSIFADSDYEALCYSLQDDYVNLDKHPCSSKPCNSAELCYANFDQFDQPFRSHVCVPKCSVDKFFDHIDFPAGSAFVAKVYTNENKILQELICQCDLNNPDFKSCRSLDLPTKRIENVVGGNSIVLKQKCLCADATIVCEREEKSFKPVCTSTGRTLINSCVAKNYFENVSFVEGSCYRESYRREICKTIHNLFICVVRLDACLFEDQRCAPFSAIMLPPNVFTAEPRDWNVCGVNGETYESALAARVNYMLVDYIGPCTQYPLKYKNLMLCKVTCPPTPKTCQAVQLPFACCPKCVPFISLTWDKVRLRAVSNGSLQISHVRRAISRQMEYASCDLVVYLSFDGAVIAALNPKKEDAFTIRNCNFEAIWLNMLINDEISTAHSDAILSSFTSSSLTLIEINNKSPCLSVSFSIIFISLFCIIVCFC